MLEIKFYQDITNSELKIYWNDLFNVVIEENSTNHPFLFNHYEWNKSWLNTVNNTKKEFICILVLKESIPILILPILIRKVLGFNFAELIGGNETDYQNLLINNFLYLKNRNKISSRLRKFFSQRKIYYFRNKSINNKMTISFIKDLFNFSFKFIYDQSSYFGINAGGENIPKKVRKNIIRVKKKNAVESKIITKENIEFEEVLDKLIYIKNKHYICNKVKEMPSQRINFYRDIASKDFSHLSYTKINNKYAAFHLGIKNRKALIYLLPTYDKEFRTLSPGWIHLEFLIKNSINNNLKTLDLTIGNESYKKRIDCNKLDTFYIFGFNNLIILPFFIVDLIYRKLYNSKKIKYYYYLFKEKFT